MLAENYLMLKHMHMMFAVISIFLFVLRFVLQQVNSRFANAKLLKVVPHINDTLLLVSAAMIAIAIQQYPFVHAWLTEKILLLILYIVLGMFALKWGKTATIKRICFACAVATFGAILYMARTKAPFILG
ncbi:SirB2 family protein [Corallincola platygyrae]|uniref:SirB2 family protein n=1 Tax=Corallincola platygyrae TaxID=1193278 RepID=A0ABW4XTK0_9GAMM